MSVRRCRDDELLPTLFTYEHYMNDPVQGHVHGALHGHRTLSTRVPLVRMTNAIRLCLDMLSLEATITGATVADLYHPLPAA